MLRCCFDHNPIMPGVYHDHDDKIFTLFLRGVMLAAIFIRGIEIGITTVPARAVFVLFINSKSYLFCSPFSTNAKTILPFLATFRRRSRGSRCWHGAFSTESSTGSYAKPAACCRSWKSATTRWTRSLNGCLDGEVIMKALRRRIGTKYHREHENTVKPRYDTPAFNIIPPIEH